VEERFCWVQTPPIQRFLRGKYIELIVDSIPKHGRVLEFGCGTGWLCQLLAEYGASRVCGVDFSQAQIRRACEANRHANCAAKVEFHQLHNSVAELADVVPYECFDALVIHGVLHHLTKQEIHFLFGELRSGLCKPGAPVSILEPVIVEGSPNQSIQSWMNLLMSLPMWGHRLGIRRKSAGELVVQKLIDERKVVDDPPRGPSPKEMPFYCGELERLLAPHVKIGKVIPVLLFSFHAARNLLLMELSHPMLARAVTWPYLWVVRAFERFLLDTGKHGGQVTVMKLLQGQLSWCRANKI
jgi:SAM-dependent methyltransferase